MTTISDILTTKSDLDAPRFHLVRLLRRAMRLMALVVLAAGAAACTDEAGEAPHGAGRPVTIELSVTARQADDLNAGATGADGQEDATEEGADGEYIHNLVVMLVDEAGMVRWKSNADGLADNDLAQGGNLRQYNEQLTIAPGTYTAYAFANLHTDYNPRWASLSAVRKGDNVHELRPDGGEAYDVDALWLDNPAGKIDLQEHFIPMSARIEDIKIDAATRYVEVGLDRLVGKVRISLCGRAGAQLTAFSMGGWANRVRLIESAADEGITYTTTVSLPLDNKPVFETNEGGGVGRLSLPDFYVNETLPPDGAATGFSIELTTDERGGTDYRATTQLCSLSRNTIYPLRLTLNDYDLMIDAQYWVSPIGHVPVLVEPVVESEDTYCITIPEGAQFCFTITGVELSSGTSSENVRWSWDIDDPSNLGFVFDSPTQNVVTVEGHVTAVAGREFYFHVTVTWTDPQYGTAFDRTYRIIVKTADLFDFELQTSSARRLQRSRGAVGLRWLPEEWLDVHRH